MRKETPDGEPRMYSKWSCTCHGVEVKVCGYSRQDVSLYYVTDHVNPVRRDQLVLRGVEEENQENPPGTR
jgi:cytochrome c551/c552